jgi:hypothetical protein
MRGQRERMPSLTPIFAETNAPSRHHSSMFHGVEALLMLLKAHRSLGIAHPAEALQLSKSTTHDLAAVLSALDFEETCPQPGRSRPRHTSLGPNSVETRWPCRNTHSRGRTALEPCRGIALPHNEWLARDRDELAAQVVSPAAEIAERLQGCAASRPGSRPAKLFSSKT